MTPSIPASARALLIAAALATPSPWAQADRGRAMPADAPPAYAQECGSCHVAYPPGLLPGRSWRQLMAGLDRHYGTDASLDPAAARRLGDWLQVHAGTARRVAEAPPEDRITRSAWFDRKHRSIDAAVWRLPAVRSAANCEACHGGAARGDYDDDALRLPAGITARQARAWRD